MEDPVLGFLASTKGASCLTSAMPKFIAEVLRMDVVQGTLGQRLHTKDTSLQSQPRMVCYGLPHFSAELGDVGYLQLLLRHYRRGFPLRWLATSSTTGVESGGAAVLGCGEAAAGMGAAEKSQFMQINAAHTPRGSLLGPAELYSFEWVAAHCSDHFGLYLSHLAACRGNIAYMDALVQLLGAKFVLQVQRCAPPLSAAFTWGPRRYTHGLSATECAVAHQQIELLRWIEAEHATALLGIQPKMAARALLIAAMSEDDRTGIFDFFLSRRIPPFDALAETTFTRGSAAASCGFAGSLHAPLQDTGVLRLLFAAAEVGNIAVLKWFDNVLVGTDVRQLCDLHGATVIHHCARGHNAAALSALLHTNYCDDSEAQDVQHLQWAPLEPMWVDVEDDQNRTPAMWCVMSPSKSKDAIATLEVLRKAGSDWSTRRRGGLSLMELAVQCTSRHSKLVRYLRANMHLSDT